MSRNSNRTGFPENPQPSHSDAPAPVVSQNPGVGPSTDTINPETPSFNWSVPTEFVTLPSRGQFYEPNHPLHNQTVAEIRYMTAKEEDILTSKSLLKEGIALDRMLQNILVDKSIRVGSLLVGDKNALIVAARRTGYGADYTTNITCPACQSVSEFTFDISEPTISDYEEVIRNGEAEMTTDGTFVVTLPLTKARVECCLLNGDDEMRLYKATEKKAKKKNALGTLTDIFRSYIVSVNGDGSPLTIESFITAMPARDARDLRKVYNSIVPNIDLTQEYSCPNCSYSADMEVPLTTDFFWPR